MGLTDALFLDPYPFEIFIAKRSDGVKGTGTLNDPYDGSTLAQFDAIMRNLPGSTLVHLGPGTFDTNGYADGVSGGWEIRPGMRIVGSGMNATTLRLVSGNTPNAHYFAVGHSLTTGSVPNPMNFCEVSDLTIDCNLQAITPVACGAIRLMGSHVKIQRVRAVNWGTSSSITPSFVIAVLTSDELFLYHGEQWRGLIPQLPLLTRPRPDCRPNRIAPIGRISNRKSRNWNTAWHSSNNPSGSPEALRLLRRKYFRRPEVGRMMLLVAPGTGSQLITLEIWSED